MGVKQKWFRDRRRKIYPDGLKEFLKVANAQGWKVNHTRAGNWEADGLLPNSLTNEEVNILAPTLKMSVNRVMVLEGYDLDEVEDLPDSAREFVAILHEQDEKTLDAIMPTLTGLLEDMIEMVNTINATDSE